MDNSKIYRLLSIYESLHKGKVINKKQTADKFAVSKKTIQRDIDDLRNFLADIFSTNRLIEYDNTKKGYVLRHKKHIWLTNQEVLAIAKVLLESRAFTKDEMKNLLDKLILHCVPEDRKHIEEVILNERFHYIPLKHGKPLFQTIWDLSLAIRKQKRIKINYIKAGTDTPVQRILEPHGIIFSEFYFYLVAFIYGYDFEFPAIYRLDHILDYTIQEDHFRIPESNPLLEKYKDGELRKRIQFMQTGHIITIKFKFWGKSLEAVLDRLPTARVVNSNRDFWLIEAEVFGRGVKMWLLSQAQYLEVVAPSDFREEMKETIREMMKLYAKP